ncbi:MAG TPA: HupE/UreJ family protein [Thermoanaerobaculia bacterium]
MAAVAAAALFFQAPAAGAHLMNTGLGPFYDGLAHPFVTPQDLLPVLALSLLAGLRGPAWGRVVLFVLPAAWLGGSLAGRLAASAEVRPTAVAILTIALGALVAADRPMPVAAVAALAVLLGLLNGGMGGLELARARAGALPDLGAACSIFVVVALLAGNVVSLSVHWARVAVRVAGSWIAAIGLLMLGWTFRGA